MFKLCIIAAIVACANGYYNHGPIAPAPYYGSYGHGVVPSVALPALNAHRGNIYNHGYGHIGAVPAQTKIIQATYPGAAHKAASYAIGHPAGYLGAGYAHGAVNHAAPSLVHAAPAIAAHAPIVYNNAPAPTYAHSQYAVNEGPINYAAHSRYAIAAAPALSYSGHHARYPVAPVAPIYPHGLDVHHRIQKIAYTPAISHMGFQSHAAQSYSW